MVAPVAEWLHARETSMIPYIDDLLLWEISRVKAQVATDRSLLALSSLGWVINAEKSSLVPTQDLDFIGATFRTDLGRAFLPHDRREVLRALGRKISAQVSLIARCYLQLLGFMAAT